MIWCSCVVPVDIIITKVLEGIPLFDVFQKLWQLWIMYICKTNNIKTYVYHTDTNASLVCDRSWPYDNIEVYYNLQRVIMRSSNLFSILSDSIFLRW